MIKNIRCCNYSFCIDPEKYIKVINMVSGLQIFFIFKYIKSDQLINKESPILSLDENRKYWIIKSSTNRELTIYKHTGGTPIFLFHTGNIPYNTTCFEVVGTPLHPITNRFLC